MLSFNLTRSLITQANHLRFTKPSNYLLLWYSISWSSFFAS